MATLYSSLPGLQSLTLSALFIRLTDGLAWNNNMSAYVAMSGLTIASNVLVSGTVQGSTDQFQFTVPAGISSDPHIVYFFSSTSIAWGSEVGQDVYPQVGATVTPASVRVSGCTGSYTGYNGIYRPYSVAVNNTYALTNGTAVLWWSGAGWCLNGTVGTTGSNYYLASAYTNTSPAGLIFGVMGNVTGTCVTSEVLANTEQVTGTAQTAADLGAAAGTVSTNLDAKVSSRSTYAGADTSGTTTLLSRIVGTLASGTHNPQSGDSYAQVADGTIGLSVIRNLVSAIPTTFAPTTSEIATAILATPANKLATDGSGYVTATNGGGGSGLTAQQTVDALALSPSAGITGTAGSPLALLWSAANNPGSGGSVVTPPLTGDPYIDSLYAARANYAAILADISLNPKPRYKVHGHEYDWSEYQAMLGKQIEECNRLIAQAAPFEIISRG
jgi:hypothetical protein